MWFSFVFSKCCQLKREALCLQIWVLESLPNCLVESLIKKIVSSFTPYFGSLRSCYAVNQEACSFYPQRLTLSNILYHKWQWRWEYMNIYSISHYFNNRYCKWDATRFIDLNHLIIQTLPGFLVFIRKLFWNTRGSFH